MPDIRFRKVLNFCAYISIVLCAIVIALGTWVPKAHILKEIGLAIALVVTAVCGLGYAKSKRSPVFIIIYAAAICMLVFAAAAIAHLFIDDYLEAKASKGAKKTILRRVIGFFKDYKSETKKIVWPGFKDVLKNTGIVLVMCLIIGALIWLVDLGLGKGLAKLLELLN